MEVIRSRVLGFCMGVRRAAALAAAEADRVKALGGRVYTLGPLIHNPKVLSDLKSRGVEVLHEVLHEEPESALPEDINGCSLIIRAHGVDPLIEEGLRSRGFHIVDATCPKVKESQLKAKTLAEAGYFLFLAGDARHAEIAGITGYASILGYASITGNAGKGTCCVVSNAAEAEAAAKKLLEAEKDAKAALIGQTTFSEEEYLNIGEAIKKYFPALEIVQTICHATRDRQQALRELLPLVDAVVVAGGRDSANTRRLLEVAQENGKPCVLVEKTSEIPAFFRTYRTVGFCAGASTPDTLISEIELELLR